MAHSFYKFLAPPIVDIIIIDMSKSLDQGSASKFGIGKNIRH